MFWNINEEESLLSDRSINVSYPILSFSKETPLNHSMVFFNSKKKDVVPIKKSSPLDFFKFKSSFEYPKTIIREPTGKYMDEYFFKQESEDFLTSHSQDIKEKLISCIFSHDYQQLVKIVEESPFFDLNFIDHRGNTLLMLATKLSFLNLEYFQIIKFLISKGASANIKDGNGISVLEEALSQADIMNISIIFDSLLRENLLKIENECQTLISDLKRILDFYIEIKWEFSSNIIPFFSHFAPSDTFKLWKIGDSFRLDSNYVDFDFSKKQKQRHWSFIFSKGKFFLINRYRKLYTEPLQKITQEEKKEIIYDLMGPNIRKHYIDLINVCIKPGTQVKKAKLQGLDTKKYQMMVKYRKIQTKKNHYYLKTNLEDYMKLNETSSTTECDQQKKIKTFQQDLSLWVSEGFPIKLTDFMPILKMAGKGNTLVGSLVKFLEQDWSSETKGFPLKVQIPLNFAFNAVVNFGNLKLFSKNEKNSEIFEIPKDFSFCERKTAQKTYKHKGKRLLLANLFLT